MSKSPKTKNLVIAAGSVLLAIFALSWWNSRSGGGSASVEGSGSSSPAAVVRENAAPGAGRKSKDIVLPPYPGSEVVLDRADSDSRVIHLETSESFDSIFDFYRRELKGSGWVQMPLEDSRMSREMYQRGDEQVVIEIQPAIRDEKLIKVIWRRVSSSG